mgnify:CR=1 FL=1
MSSSADIRFVLFETTHPGNIGSVSRAIKTMGFHQLYLVNPPAEYICTDSRAMASGAQDVLHGAKVVGSLPEALEGCEHTYPDGRQAATGAATKVCAICGQMLKGRDDKLWG